MRKKRSGKAYTKKGEKKLQSQAVTQVNLLLRQNRKLVRLPLSLLKNLPLPLGWPLASLSVFAPLSTSA